MSTVSVHRRVQQIDFSSQFHNDRLKSRGSEDSSRTLTAATSSETTSPESLCSRTDPKKRCTLELHCVIVNCSFDNGSVRRLETYHLENNTPSCTTTRSSVDVERLQWVSERHHDIADDVRRRYHQSELQKPSTEHKDPHSTARPPKLVHADFQDVTQIACTRNVENEITVNAGSFAVMIQEFDMHADKCNECSKVSNETSRHQFSRAVALLQSRTPQESSTTRKGPSKRRVFVWTCSYTRMEEQALVFHFGGANVDVLFPDPFDRNFLPNDSLDGKKTFRRYCQEPSRHTSSPEEVLHTSLHAPPQELVLDTSYVTAGRGSAYDSEDRRPKHRCREHRKQEEIPDGWTRTRGRRTNKMLTNRLWIPRGCCSGC